MRRAICVDPLRPAEAGPHDHSLVDEAIQQLLAILDAAYDRKSWHGTNLRGSIRGLSTAQATWRPARGRHNIWELVVHAAYWKYVARRRLLGESRGSFPLKGSNWFMRPERESDTAWRSEISLDADRQREATGVRESWRMADDVPARLAFDGREAIGEVLDPAAEVEAAAGFAVGVGAVVQ